MDEVSIRAPPPLPHTHFCVLRAKPLSLPGSLSVS